MILGLPGELESFVLMDPPDEHEVRPPGQGRTPMLLPQANGRDHGESALEFITEDEGADGGVVNKGSESSAGECLLIHWGWADRALDNSMAETLEAAIDHGVLVEDLHDA